MKVKSDVTIKRLYVRIQCASNLLRDSTANLKSDQDINKIQIVSHEY